MYRNIGKRIRLLAVILAALTLVAFLVLAVVFLVAALRASDATMRAAGIEGAVLFAVLAFLLPLFSWVLYGFGVLVESNEKQAADTREMRDMLKKALADGALSDEVARKTGIALSKLAPAATAAAPRAGLAQTRPHVRPIQTQRPTPAAPAPVKQEPLSVQEAPVEEPIPAAAPAPVEPTVAEAETAAAPKATFAPQPEPVKKADTPFVPPVPTAPVAPGKPFDAKSAGAGVQPIRPLNQDTTY